MRVQQIISTFESIIIPHSGDQKYYHLPLKHFNAHTRFTTHLSQAEVLSSTHYPTGHTNSATTPHHVELGCSSQIIVCISQNFNKTLSTRNHTPTIHLLLLIYKHPQETYFAVPGPDHLGSLFKYATRAIHSFYVTTFRS